MKLKNFRYYTALFCLLGSLFATAPLAASNCGCDGYYSDDCGCGTNCGCEANDQEKYIAQCQKPKENNCDNIVEDNECAKNPCECFIKGVTFGIDYLYWKPCISGLHYAVTGETDLGASTNKHKYNYVSPSAESGFRVYNITEMTTEGLFVKAIYTDLGCESSHCVASQASESVQLSRGQPFDSLYANGAKGVWEMKYQTVEVVGEYKLDLEIFAINLYGGVDVMLLDQKLNSKSTDSFSEETRNVEIRQRQQYFGAGPILGAGTTVAITDCLNFFFDANVNLLIGSADETDKFHWEIDNTRTEDRHYKSEDCYCFPGWHLQFGLGYKTSYCGYDIGFRLGYEFLQYTNAPFYLDYEQGEDGILSGSNSNNLSLRGLFTGIFVGF